MNPNIIKTLLGGIVGTLTMSLMMRFVAPMMVGQPMDIAAMIGNMMGNNYAMGMVAHIMLGVLVFPLLYALVVFRFLPGGPLIKGMTWGVILWLIAETLVMPMAGAGFFMSEIGGMKAVMAALMGHLVYGGLLGVIAGRSDSCCSAHPNLA
ncbi:MAG: hypothetical protein Q7U18_03705 [Methylobacter sp.]|jgi:uncharacterized membrane protein YagU involved in acid resistance|nr:hypothetical protein [Methylobacter sp.]